MNQILIKFNLILNRMRKRLLLAILILDKILYLFHQILQLTLLLILNLIRKYNSNKD